MDLQDISAMILDPRTKGIPFTAGKVPLAAIGAQGWNVLREDLPLPLMVLRRAALDHNARVFGDYLRTHHLSFAPHGKTTMAPQLYAEQLAHGAWAITAATVGQVQVMHHYGVDRVILANALIGRAHLASVAAMLAAREDFELYVFVDSQAQLREMTRHLDGVAMARPLRLLVEIGVEGGRTGLRLIEDATALAQTIARADPAKFLLAGIAGFEGVVPGASDDAIRAYADRIVAAAAALPPDILTGLDEFVITAGGSSHFDIMAERFARLALPVPSRIVLRSGCYVTTDHGAYRQALETAEQDPSRNWSARLSPALEVWAYVQSRPEEGLAFLTMGKRDVPHDAGLPVPIRRYRHGAGDLAIGEAEVFALNDQHAYVRLGAGSDWQVGDMIACGISHPCTAFDKWRLLPVVDEEMNVIDGVVTFF